MHYDFVDRLAERIRFDRYGFLAFAFVGSLLIVVAKAEGVSATLSAVVAVIVMLGYAYLVRHTDMGRVRADQAGDNCYYLGLVYTLSSLAFTIFTFDPANTATAIVQGFGVALATTVAGLILRVFFSQTRVDLVEIEDEGRVELTEAANQLKTSLSHISSDMNAFSRGTRQMLDEARADALAAANEAFAEFGAQSKRLGASTARVVNAMEGQADRFERLNAAVAGAASGLDGISAGAQAASATLAMVDAQAKTITAQQVVAKTEASAMASMLETQTKAVADLQGAIRAMQASIGDGLAALEAAPSTALKRAADDMIGATARMQDQVTKLGEASREVIAGIKEELADTARAVKAHNGTMEDDLARSRSNVSKVHGALVEMTGTLVSQVSERRTQ